MEPITATYPEASQKMLLTIIKGKLKGKAKTALNIHPHLLTWTEIKSMLETNFGGLSSPEQLYEDLRNSQYRGDVMKFYNYVLSKLSLLNQRHTMDGTLIDIHQNNKMALNVFMNKLPIHHRTILCALKPTSLERALHELAMAGLINKNNNNQYDDSQMILQKNPIRNQSYEQQNNQRQWQQKAHTRQIHQRPDQYQQHARLQYQHNHLQPQYNNMHTQQNQNHLSQQHNLPKQHQWQYKQHAPQPMEISGQTRHNYCINNSDKYNNDYLSNNCNVYQNKSVNNNDSQRENFRTMASIVPPDDPNCPMFSSEMTIEQLES